MAKVEVRITKKNGSTLVLGNKYINNINIKRDQVKDYKFPVFGCVSQTGSITFNDTDRTIYKAIINEEFEYSTQVSVWLKGKKYGVYYMKEPDYDTTSFVFTIQVEDIIARLDSIDMPEISMTTIDYKPINYTTLNSLFNKFKVNLQSKLTTLSWIIPDFSFNEIIIPNANISEGTARQQFDKILFYGSSVAYSNADGNIVIEPKYSYNTNRDYLDGKYNYILKKNMLSTVRTNILKPNKFNNVSIDNLKQAYSNDNKTKAFTLNIDLSNANKLTISELQKNYPQFKELTKSSYYHFHGLTDGMQTRSSTLNYLQFYVDYDVDDVTNQMASFDTYVTLTTNSNDGSNTYTDYTMSGNVVRNATQVINTVSPVFPNMKVTFAPNTLWSGSTRTWSEMPFDEYFEDENIVTPTYTDYDNTYRNGYIHIIRLSNKRLRLFCRIVYDYTLTVAEDEVWTSKIKVINIDFSAITQETHTFNYSNGNNANDYIINGYSDILYNYSTMPNYKEGYYDYYDKNGNYNRREWLEFGSIPEIITQSIAENFEFGLLTADVSVMMSDYIGSKSQYTLSWENGDRLEVGNKVMLLNSNTAGSSQHKNSMLFDRDGNASVFEIVSTEFVYEGYPKLNLKLLEIRKDWYDKGYLGRIDL